MTAKPVTKMEKNMSGKKSGSIIQDRIREVKHFECSDGEVFTDRNDAVSYESALRRLEMFQDLLVEVGVPESVKERVAQGLFDNKTVVLKLLGETNRRLKNYRRASKSEERTGKRGPGRPSNAELAARAEEEKNARGKEDQRGPGRPPKTEVSAKGDTPWGKSKELTKIMNVVRRTDGPCTKSRISQNTHIAAKPLKKLLKHLCSEGFLTEEPTSNNLGFVYTEA